MNKDEVIENNAKIVQERNGRPGLDYRMKYFVVAVDIEDPHLVLLGGLGSMGIGQMWFRGNYFDHPNYNKAPRIKGAAPAMDTTNVNWGKDE